MKKIPLLFMLIFLLCKEAKQNVDQDIPPTVKNPMIEKICVIAKDGLSIYSKPSSNSEVITSVSKLTKLDVIEYSDYETIGKDSGKWAKISFHNKVGFLFDQQTIWDCSLYNEELIEPDKINDRSIVGFWGEENYSPYYIHFMKDHTFDGNIWNGCDEDGCISYNVDGDWKIVNDVIYMRSVYKSDNQSRFYIYVVREKKLTSTDLDYSFLQNYGNESVSGIKKIKK
ncbi:SH3 domain-containing protein [Leptospira perdikensis]|uniref:SH3 domain-containing protein n=1 Tax=Leptospira perdikensis TaxID=2484948 RepID=A0A4R9JGX6_9LEPT|nr:SH3 domain-containing protein [Leptospira perdikensis]TGL38987.1 SH3 domain-containing protein [Leptospira perdikensis]